LKFLSDAREQLQQEEQLLKKEESKKNNARWSKRRNACAVSSELVHHKVFCVQFILWG